MHTHFQFTVKYRRDAITAAIAEEIKKSFVESCGKLGARLVAFGGDEDHIHSVVEHPEALPVGTIAGRLKGASSRHVRKLFPGLARVHADHFWSPSYSSKPCDHYLERAVAYDAAHPLAGQWWR